MRNNNVTVSEFQADEYLRMSAVLFGFFFNENILTVQTSSLTGMSKFALLCYKLWVGHICPKSQSKNSHCHTK